MHNFHVSRHIYWCYTMYLNLYNGIAIPYLYKCNQSMCELMIVMSRDSYKIKFIGKIIQACILKFSICFNYHDRSKYNTVPCVCIKQSLGLACFVFHLHIYNILKFKFWPQNIFIQKVVLRGISIGCFILSLFIESYYFGDNGRLEYIFNVFENYIGLKF